MPSTASHDLATNDQIEATARRVLEEIAAVGTGTEVQLDEYISILAKYRHTCEKRSNYKEAELVQHVLKQLRLEEENRHVYALTQQQDLERQGLEEAHMLEFQNFNQIWNEKIDSFEEHQLECEAVMLEQHSMELTKFHGAMTAEAPKRAKFSKDLLNLRKIQETLAKQKNYVEAQKVKLKADRLETIELERINRERGDRYAKKESKILVRHRHELLAMRKRMERGRIELERRRKKEMEMLLQRYNNVKRGLLGQHNIIKAKTGNMLMKHAANKKTDASGSQAIVTSMNSGTFGPGIKKRNDASYPSATEVVRQIQQEVAETQQDDGSPPRSESRQPAAHENMLPPV
ncbi:immunodominant antigen [Diplonema papillatum]|nr:immunodominant antigen [Diplonema papillatum]